jgi:hypothetical protein
MEWEHIYKRLCGGGDIKEKAVAYFKDYPGICLEGEETQNEILGKKIKTRSAKQATHKISYNPSGTSRHM